MKVMQLHDIRGWRNHNPGSIRHGNIWHGLRTVQTDDDFCQFISPEFGIRAMSRTLNTYYSKHGLRTLREIINRWAPPSENETDAYVRSVCQRVGLAEDQRLPMGIEHMKNPLIKAIIHHQLGCQPYSDWLIDTSILWDLQGVPRGLLPN
ncbi:MAG: structural protein [Endozoicomonas sp.]